MEKFDSCICFNLRVYVYLTNPFLLFMQDNVSKFVLTDH